MKMSLSYTFSSYYVLCLVEVRLTLSFLCLGVEILFADDQFPTFNPFNSRIIWVNDGLSLGFYFIILAIISCIFNSSLVGLSSIPECIIFLKTLPKQ